MPSTCTTKEDTKEQEYDNNITYLYAAIDCDHLHKNISESILIFSETLEKCDYLSIIYALIEDIIPDNDKAKTFLIENKICLISEFKKYFKNNGISYCTREHIHTNNPIKVNIDYNNDKIEKNVDITIQFMTYYLKTKSSNYNYKIYLKPILSYMIDKTNILRYNIEMHIE